jgi:hypothetical protein
VYDGEMIDLPPAVNLLTCLSSISEMPKAASNWLNMLGINTAAIELKFDITSNMRVSYGSDKSDEKK